MKVLKLLKFKTYYSYASRLIGRLFLGGLINENYYESLVETILDTGKELVASGAEVNRAEDTLVRLGEAYGADEVNIFVIYNSLSAAMKFEGRMYNQTRSLKSPTDTDFSKISKLNALSRKCALQKPELCELKMELEKITSVKKSALRVFAGGAIAAGAFLCFSAERRQRLWWRQVSA